VPQRNSVFIFNGCLLKESFTEREDDLRMTWISGKLEKIACFAEFVIFSFMFIQDLKLPKNFLLAYRKRAFLINLTQSTSNKSGLWILIER